MARLYTSWPLEVAPHQTSSLRSAARASRSRGSTASRSASKGFQSRKKLVSLVVRASTTCVCR
jgi:hypothetical protein